jgi:hypothetical protein
METKKFTQIGTFSIILLGIIFIISSVIMVIAGFDNPGGYVCAAVNLIILITLVISHKLTITVNQDRISFKLGVGFIGRSYKIADIKSCKPVKNSLLYGVGIHIIPGGILYNVSGLQAIELQFKNRRQVLRIGTDKPEEICNLLQTYISNEPSFGERSTGFISKKYAPFWTILVLTLLLPVLFIIVSGRETKVVFENGSFKITGIYGMSIPLNDLVQVDTVSGFPDIEMRTNGYALGKTRKGNFRLVDKTNVKLFIKKGNTPYIIIHAKNQKPIYLNFENRQETIELYNKLKRIK